MAVPPAILHLEDDALDARLVDAELQSAQLAERIRRVSGRAEFELALEDPGLELILSDFSIPGFDGMEALDLSHARRPEVPFLFVSGALGEELAIESLKRGATDYVLKQRLDRLVPSVLRALREAKERAERKRAERALGFLAEASALLASSLDVGETLPKVAQLAVPTLADWCAIDLVQEDRRVRRVAVAHVQDEAAWALQELAESYPIHENPQHPVAQVLRSGTPLLEEDVEDIAAHRPARDARQAQLLRQVGACSYMVLPLVAHQRSVGTVTFGSLTRARRYGPSDLVLSQEVARRTAVAIENGRLYKEARDAARTREELLAVVSHDLRNPLGAISASAALIAKGKADPSRIRHHAETIQRSAQRMGRLISDLLDLASMEGGRLMLNRRRHPIARVLEEIASVHQPLAAEKGVSLFTELGAAGRYESEAAVDADLDRLLQILSNLVGNAIKFTPEGGRVSVSFQELDGVPEFCVADTGPGIAPEHQAHLFERYWQARNTPRQGIGLGLSIAQGLVLAHGGRIWLESAPAQGTRFYFTLPPRTAAAAAEEPAAEDGSRPESAPPI